MSPEVANMLIGFGLTCVGSFVGFLVARFFRATDKSTDQIDKLREDVGVLKRDNQSQWKKIDEQKEDIRELRGSIERIREKL
jgi:TolA-binding protein